MDDEDFVDLGVEVVLPEAEEVRWGDLLLAFDIGVGDDLGIRTGADMVDAKCRQREGWRRVARS